MNKPVYPREPIEPSFKLEHPSRTVTIPIREIEYKTEYSSTMIEVVKNLNDAKAEQDIEEDIDINRIVVDYFYDYKWDEHMVRFAYQFPSKTIPNKDYDTEVKEYNAAKNQYKKDHIKYVKQMQVHAQQVKQFHEDVAAYKEYIQTDKVKEINSALAILKKHGINVEANDTKV